MDIYLLDTLLYFCLPEFEVLKSRDGIELIFFKDAVTSRNSIKKLIVKGHENDASEEQGFWNHAHLELNVKRKDVSHLFYLSRTIGLHLMRKLKEYNPCWNYCVEAFCYACGDADIRFSQIFTEEPVGDQMAIHAEQNDWAQYYIRLESMGE